MLIAFWALSVSLVITPGADWAYAISAGMRQKAIGPAVLGMLAGYLMITVVVAAGVGALVTRVPVMLTVMTLLGAAYLFWLGYTVFMHPSVPATDEERTSNTWFGWAARGFIVSGMNPKAILLFLALMPQFTNADSAWSIPAQITTMGFVQIINCAVVYSLVGLGSKVVLSARPHVARRVSQFSGLSMMVIAIVLIVGSYKS
jgi:threonine/homoserine/homoserine lactone efflux protein